MVSENKFVDARTAADFQDWLCSAGREGMRDAAAYFRDNVLGAGRLANIIKLVKMARFVDPFFVASLSDQEMLDMVRTLELSQDFKADVDNLKKELSTFKTHCATYNRANPKFADFVNIGLVSPAASEATDVAEPAAAAADTPDEPASDDEDEVPADTRRAAHHRQLRAMAIQRFWHRHGNSIPSWDVVARRFALYQPSSATAERVFSIMKNHFDKRRNRADEELLAASVMLRYNELSSIASKRFLA